MTARASRAATRDERMMRRALRAAARGDGRTHPNPSVGAVVFRGDRVLGVGTTRPPGGPHAEIVAMERARRRHGAAALRGAALAVTLEPCSFFGRTPPCVDAILEAGITRVVAGCRDPHHRVSGRGFARLRRAGVEVESGVLEEECLAQHAGFRSVCERGRPFVTLKLGTTLDGRIATARGESRWITSEQSRARVHRLRERSDAVMVGSATALADDPELSARRAGRVVRWPVRVVVDGRLRVPASARLFTTGRGTRPGAETWLVCGEGSPGLAAARRRAERVIEVPRDRARHVDLGLALRRLAEEGLTTILVEGGGRLAAALLRADLVDEVHWFLAPRLIGGDGLPALGALALERLDQAKSLAAWRVERCGPDLHVWGPVARRDGKSRAAKGRKAKGRDEKARMSNRRDTKSRSTKRRSTKGRP